MRKIIYSMGVSLDGFIAGPGGEIAVPAPDEELHRFYNHQMSEIGAHLMGRRLYEVMSYWDTFAEENPSAPEHELEFARIWEETPKVVFSRTLEKVEGAKLVRDGVAEVVAELKQQPGGDVAVGGAGLASSLMELGLVDEYRPLVYPVLAGGGTPFFPPSDEKIDLRLVETRTFSSGVVDLRYDRVTD
jgi:dihydrofolate reductase